MSARPVSRRCRRRGLVIDVVAVTQHAAGMRLSIACIRCAEVLQAYRVDGIAVEQVSVHKMCCLVRL